MTDRPLSPLATILILSALAAGIAAFAPEPTPRGMVFLPLTTTKGACPTMKLYDVFRFDGQCGPEYFAYRIDIRGNPLGTPPDGAKRLGTFFAPNKGEAIEQGAEDLAKKAAAKAAAKGVVK